MGIVPSIPAKPANHRMAESPEPLEVAAELSPDDWARALLHLYRDAHVGQRRRILTVFLPLLWFLTLLAVFANWFTEPGRKDLASFLHDAARLPLEPVGVFLGIATLLALLSWLTRPWLLRRRARRLIDDDFREPLPVWYRFDESGIVLAERDRSSLVPWSWVEGLEESDRALFFQTGRIEEPMVLPRGALSDEAMASVRRWAEMRIGNATKTSETPPVEPAGNNDLRLRFELTADDRTVLATRAQETSQARRQRRIGFAIVFASLSLVWPAFYAFAWIVDPHRVPLDIAFPLYLEMFADLFWMPAAVFAVLLAGLMLVHPWLRIWTARGMGDFLQSHARLGEIAVAVGEDGITTAQGEGKSRFGWRSIQGVERGKDHILLPLSRGTVIVLPRRAFDAASMIRFEALAASHLGPSSASGTPT